VQVRFQAFLDSNRLMPKAQSTLSTTALSLLVGCNKAVTDKLQRVMNAAARVVSGIRKYDCGMRHLRHAELHWLDVAD